ncbi:PREDICTED: chromatin modification-related protein EAF3-like isoform X1 [Populus euphratica]|uniref:Chromatin modification-related protein EAF3-like isoform X1 n=1 Tax=Populus euphratica TaxID=75702 RepID=A0AAJ6UI23_POPEU|nr:PREDICTED: chromatin modification-related protein EAF3-like isoform X1 [Populus euphratica]
MGSSDTGLNNDDDSATVSDESNTETDSDMRTETDDECQSSHPPSVFVNDEKVLAFHSGQYYEAKVIRALYEENKWGFFVHYTGWNKTWDEWVGTDRLLKHTEENVQKQKALKERLEMEMKTKAVQAPQMKLKNSGVSRGRKRKNDNHNKEKDLVPLEKLVNLQIPPTLKKQLVDDCEFITHQSKLVKLPRTPNVQDICKKYCEYRSKKDVMMPESTAEIMKGLRCYFDKALPAMLLYKSERQQYTYAIRDDVSPSMVYGAEHLLRLFVKLPELLVHANIEEETLTELHQKFVDFLRFLQKNQSAFFLSRYHVPEDSEANTIKQGH